MSERWIAVSGTPGTLRYRRSASVHPRPSEHLENHPDILQSEVAGSAIVGTEDWEGSDIKGESERDPKCAAFIEWAAATTRLGSFTETNCYGLRWKAKTIRKRWRVVSGEENDYTGDAAVLRRPSEYPRPGRPQ